MAGSVHSHGVGGGMADSKVYTPIRGRSGSGGRGGRGGRGQNPLALNPELNVVSTVDNAAPDKSWASISDLSCSVFLIKHTICSDWLFYFSLSWRHSHRSYNGKKFGVACQV
ncbi:uncharacterized protein LOC114294772 isoform X2 [Camellia sinensis]|uniref:uncharacterized protein LOC114294772 isoform X2 n=1 Tax=Camellia sinensis TaxID=4442 RepID=UPI0010358969|nr:uncharacterized protein LOC114294772 isoform X2 [Camellia sinensis]